MSNGSIHPSFLNIDAEGSEEFIINGGNQIIRECRPYIFFECGYDGDLENYPHIRWLSAASYTVLCANIHHMEGSWVNMGVNSLEKTVCLADDSIFFRTKLMNLFAIPNEKLAKIKNLLYFVSSNDMLEIARSLRSDAYPGPLP